MALSRTDALRDVARQAGATVTGRYGQRQRYDELHVEFAAAVAKLRADTSLVSFADRTALAEYLRTEEFLAKRGL